MFGRQLLSTHVINPTRLSYDGSPEYKAGGITIDLTTLAAASGADTTLADGSVIRAGSQFLRYGQVLTKITATGKYGPYDPAAGDGRQNLVRGQAFILDEVFVVTPGGALLPASNEIRGGVIEGGRVWTARLLQSGTGTHTLAAGPTFAELQAAFPRLQFVEM